MPPELVGAAAEVIPGASPEWLRGFLADCGPYGLELAVLALAWVAARLAHRKPDSRPENPRSYAKATVLGGVKGPGWRIRLDRGEITMADIRAEIQASPRVATKGPWDPGPDLRRLWHDGVGFELDPLAEGEVRAYRRDGVDGDPFAGSKAEDRRMFVERRAEIAAFLRRKASEKGGPS